MNNTLNKCICKDMYVRCKTFYSPTIKSTIFISVDFTPKGGTKLYIQSFELKNDKVLKLLFCQQTKYETKQKTLVPNG